MKKEPYSESRTKVKICGITNLDEISFVNQIGPEYVGFVFAKKSRRFLPYAEAARLKEQLDASIQTVGVFVDENPRLVAELLEKRIIDVAQLHGKEDDNYLKELHKLTDRPLIKAFHIANSEDLIQAQKSTAEYLLFDSLNAGSGTTFDWSLLESVERPYFLAGGLNPGNITEALKQLTPFAVDVSSGVEINGKKDNDKIKQFVQSVRDWSRKEQ